MVVAASRFSRLRLLLLLPEPPPLLLPLDSLEDEKEELES
jgi:hypothetical protein